MDDQQRAKKGQQQQQQQSHTKRTESTHIAKSLRFNWRDERIEQNSKKLLYSKMLETTKQPNENKIHDTRKPQM